MPWFLGLCSTFLGSLCVAIMNKKSFSYLAAKEPRQVKLLYNIYREIGYFLNFVYFLVWCPSSAVNLPLACPLVDIIFVYIRTHNSINTAHRHPSNIDCLMAYTVCLVCFISTVNDCSKKRKMPWKLWH